MPRERSSEIEFQRKASQIEQSIIGPEDDGAGGPSVVSMND